MKQSIKYVNQFYDYKLDLYLVNNKNKTELDFIQHQISELNKNIKQKNDEVLIISRNIDEDEIKKIKSKYFKEYDNHLGFEPKTTLTDFILNKINIANDMVKVYQSKQKKIELNNSTKVTPLERLKFNYDVLEKLDLFPDVKCDLEEVLSDLRNGLTEDIIEQNKHYLVKKLYLNNEPDIYYTSELERVTYHMNDIIKRLDEKFKNYKDFVVDVPMGKHTFRTYDVYQYFQISTIHFRPFYSFAKSRIDEIKELSQKKIPHQPDIKHPFKDSKTLELFNYIVDKWDYDKGQMWADIYTYIDDLVKYEMPEKKDYQRYIILRFQYTGKFQYDIISNKNQNALFDLVDDFSKR